MKIATLILVSIPVIFVAVKLSEDSPPAKPQQKTNSTAPVEVATGIPGITPADVYLPLEERGFKTEKIFDGDLGFTAVSESKFENVRHHVTSHGPNTRTVSTITLVTTVNAGKSVEPIALPIFAYLATLPYDGADPSKARQWVEQNINVEGASTVIGGVKFEVLKVGPFLRNMSISSIEG